jgi:DNA-binding PadR family transcriptional regulator
MTTTAQSFRFFILGLLGEQAMSGYDIRQMMKRLGWLIGSPSFGAIYPALHALLAEEQVTVEVISRPDRPPRKLYSITETGKRALTEWVARLDGTNGSLRTFVQRLILVGDYDHPDRLLAHLRQRRDTVSGHHRALQRAASDLAVDTGIGHRLAVEYGLATASAELDWLHRAIGRLSPDKEGDSPEPRPEQTLTTSV